MRLTLMQFLGFVSVSTYFHSLIFHQQQTFFCLEFGALINKVNKIRNNRLEDAKSQLSWAERKYKVGA